MSVDVKTADALRTLKRTCEKYEYCNVCPLGGFTSDDMCICDWSPRNWYIEEVEFGKFYIDIDPNWR